MIFAHKIALDLTKSQEAYCRRAAGTARFTYNWALAEWQRQYRAGEKPTALKLKTQWNALKHERFQWVAEVHKDANQQPFTHLRTAFQKFFRREAGYPTFKKKDQHDQEERPARQLLCQQRQMHLPGHAAPPARPGGGADARSLTVHGEGDVGDGVSRGATVLRQCRRTGRGRPHDVRKPSRGGGGPRRATLGDPLNGRDGGGAEALTPTPPSAPAMQSGRLA